MRKRFKKNIFQDKKGSSGLCLKWLFPLKTTRFTWGGGKFIRKCSLRHFYVEKRVIIMIIVSGYNGNANNANLKCLTESSELMFYPCRCTTRTRALGESHEIIKNGQINGKLCTMVKYTTPNEIHYKHFGAFRFLFAFMASFTCHHKGSTKIISVITEQLAQPSSEYGQVHCKGQHMNPCCHQQYIFPLILLILVLMNAEMNKWTTWTWNSCSICMCIFRKRFHHSIDLCK